MKEEEATFVRRRALSHEENVGISHTEGFEGFFASNLEGNVTERAPHKILSGLS